MARVIVESYESGKQVIELRLGVNRLGRGPTNDFELHHPTISTNHCEIFFGGGGVVVRDKGSTNGTFVNGRRIQAAKLGAGDTLHLGHLQLVVETTDVVVAIPKIEMTLPASVALLADGSMPCPRHPRARVAYRCTHCEAVMCEACLHQLRRLRP